MWHNVSQKGIFDHLCTGISFLGFWFKGRVLRTPLCWVSKRIIKGCLLWNWQTATSLNNNDSGASEKIKSHDVWCFCKHFYIKVFILSTDHYHPFVQFLSTGVLSVYRDDEMLVVPCRTTSPSQNVTLKTVSILCIVLFVTVTFMVLSLKTSSIRHWFKRVFLIYVTWPLWAEKRDFCSLQIRAARCIANLHHRDINTRNLNIAKKKISISHLLPELQ